MLYIIIIIYHMITLYIMFIDIGRSRAELIIIFS